MWKTMLYRELECVPCLVRSETNPINSSPWRNPLLLVRSGKAFVRTVDGEEQAAKEQSFNHFPNRVTEPLEDSSKEESVVACG